MDTPAELIDGSMSTPTLQDQGNVMDPAPSPKRGYAFWMVFVANVVVDLLSALDLTAVATALPTIVSDLHGSDFIWATSAYSIASTAILPTVGGLVSCCGRKPVLLAFLLFFTAGSAISGAARNMNMLIAGRAIQGLGGGGCISVTEIIYADLIPLPERGKFIGITAAIWALASVAGPPIGGALAGSGAWRWLFFLNLPLCGIAAVLIVVFLNVRAPKTDFRTRIAGMDWIGLSIIITGTMIFMLALTWGGATYPWASVQVLLPLCLGTVAIIVFFYIEIFWIKNPTVPAFIITNRTTLSGYLATFFHGIASMAAIYYLPVYFQACKTASPIQSGIDSFGISFFIPIFSILAGASVEVFNVYRPQNYVGWIMMIIGFGLLSMLEADSPRAHYIGFQTITGMGLGVVWIGPEFPILAPLPFSNNAHALAFYTFVRCFAQTWGTVIGGAVLQNVLSSRLPASFIASFPDRSQLAYTIIPEIPSLSQPLKTEVQIAYAQSTAIIWRVMIGVSGVGLLTCLLMKEVKMRKDMDENWGLKERGKLDVDSENGVSEALASPTEV
ncbi:iron permease [Leucogyrophana mollusca]|uniref:Iron permease n=1 Tax=Leucogyrophana mollusca TaxID=85980 RepID=A0ACB8BTJ8_9AGAM|nr:iron permease [Leucogyrophana mollusca]